MPYVDKVYNLKKHGGFPTEVSDMARNMTENWVAYLLSISHKMADYFMKDEVLLTVGCPIFPPFYIDNQISVHRKFKQIDQLIFRNAKEIYFNEKFPIL